VSEQSSENPSGAARSTGSRVWRWLRWIGLFFVALIVAIGLFIGYKLWGPTVTSEELTGLSKENIQGLVDAPVKIVEFGDFACPSCRRWHRSGIKQQVMEMFGDQVSFTYRHFPVMSEHSVQAAIASQCAGEQGAFWMYHDFLFEQAEGLTESELARYAMALGLNTLAFEACVQSEKVRDYVDRDKRSAFREGALGTPAFFVNGQLVYNPSFEELETLIRKPR
jgi:protein-disulfide isomerase